MGYELGCLVLNPTILPLTSYLLPLTSYLQHRMSQSQEIMGGFHVQTSGFDKAHEIVGVVHFTVAVGDGSEIEADLSEAERSGVETLAIPKRLHDVEARIGAHHLGGAT